MSKRIVIGRIVGVYGVQGWVKVYSETQPIENIFEYQPWQVKLQIERNWRSVTITEGRRQGKGLIAHIQGVDDRDWARRYIGSTIAIDRDQLPEAEEDEVYWADLEGAKISTLDGQLLGRVHHVMPTGANEVLVVRPCEDSMDDRERLIPYLPDQVVQKMDLAAGEIEVDWDPEF